MSDTSREPQFGRFHSLKNKLLVLMIALSLIPLAGMSIFSYFIGSRDIQGRIKLSLDKVAKDTADKVDLMLIGRKQEIISMATTHAIIYPKLSTKDRSSLIQLLNQNFISGQEVYDALIVLDRAGNFIGINTIDRDLKPLPEKKIIEVLGKNISAFPEEQKMFQSSLAGNSFHHDWYQSKIVKTLNDYRELDESYQYNIAFSEPIKNSKTGEIMGVWINIINWFYFQNILDKNKQYFEKQNMKTGYGFMLAKDANTFIGHKYRSSRSIETSGGANERSFYNTRLIEDYGLRGVHEAALHEKGSYAFELPKGEHKLVGLKTIEDNYNSFKWIVGVQIDEAEIFRPIKSMSYWLFGATIVLALLVVLFTYLIAEGITVRLKTLIGSASTIAQGNFNQRVPVRSSDEVGILASTFNEMARALSVREIQLQELNRNLESMVHERTMELENSHEALKQAYFDLQSTQEQLVQTEKMASLGHLVSGIAHEIKNPLNFIYGNTGFLADYTQKLRILVESFEKLPSLSPEDREEIERQKESNHYSFIREDLKTLIDNFTEGARRINAIVSDLRTFSRMDTDEISEVDVHASLEISLNLLRNQYKNRIEIHTEFGDIPKIQGYSGKINQVFMNLLANAFHAVRGNGDVWIRTRSNNGAVEIEIEDNGVGIPKENLKRIFEPFFTTKPIGQGTGLGLSISYGIIEQHQGKIHVASIPDKGTTFTVRLPIFQEKAE
jgi:two-component system, NtrC family, sensor kinase